MNKISFWHDKITDQSFRALQEIRKRYNFVLIGGWAVYFYTKSLKSKDIDIVVPFETLGQLRADFNLRKNDRLKKYEISMGEFDVDIYTSHWSELGIPVNHILENPQSLEGFFVPKKETLLALKLFTYTQRQGNIKGRKDAIDVMSLLFYTKVDFKKFKSLLDDNNLSHLLNDLKELLNSMTELKELNLNNKSYADLKKKILPKL